MYPNMFNFLPQGRGKNLTPNLDRLVAEGTILMNQHVASPVCTPSRFNCLTGRYASRAQNNAFLERTASEEQSVVEWNSYIRPEDPIILSKLLKEQGYHTGFVGKNHVIEAPELHPFPDYNASARDPENAAKLKANHEIVKAAVRRAGFDYAESLYHNNPTYLGLAEVAVQNLDWIAQAGLEFIEQAQKNPFFLYFATTVPHAPAQPERSWNADPRITAEGWIDTPPNVLPPRATIPERLKAAGIKKDKKANLLWLDDALGALISKLEECGQLDNTIILFFNDHGQDAKGSLYQGGVLDPSVIWKQGGFACGSVCNALVSNVDFAPTLLELSGGDPATIDFDGNSFETALSGVDQDAERALFFELGYARAVRKGRWKYLAIRYPEAAEKMTSEQREQALKAYNDDRRSRNQKVINEDPTKPFSHLMLVPGGGSAERPSLKKYPAYHAPDQLYDLENDPDEQNNLAAHPEYRQQLETMKTELKRHLDTLPGSFEL